MCNTKAINYILMDSEQKIKIYQRQKQKMGRFKVRRLNKDDYARYKRAYKHCDEEKGAEMRLVKRWKRKLAESQHSGDCSAIYREIQSYKDTIIELKSKKRALEEKVNEHKLALYEHFVSGLLTNNSLNIEQMSEWKKYRQCHQIDENEHILVLNRFGFADDDALDKIKNYVQPAKLERNDSSGSNQSASSLKESTTKMVTSGNNECVICFAAMSLTTDTLFMMTPCNHICICSECVMNYYSAPHNGQKCPICCNEIEDVKTVYFS